MRCYSLKPNQLSQYYKKETSWEEKLLTEKNQETKKLKEKRNPQSDENLKKKRIKNELSYGAIKRLKEKVNWLCFLSENRTVKVAGFRIQNFKAAFVTLQLPSIQKHDHDLIVKKCLNNFLNLLRKNHSLKNYVWKVELQKNGNLHIHVVIDVPIAHNLIRSYWNSSVELLGYVTAYQEKFSKLSFNQYLKLRNSQGSPHFTKNKKSWEYGKKTNWRKPNCTDIHKLKNIKNVAAYVAKYLSKKSHEGADKNYEESLKKLNGRLWYCSQSLSRMKSVIIPINFEIKRLFEKLSGWKKVYRIIGDYFDCLFFNIEEIPKASEDFLKMLLWNYAHKKEYPTPVTLF